LARADAHNPFFNHEPHEKARKFIGVAALTDEIALPKFLRDKTGFTFSVGGDMERRRLAGMKPASLSHHRKIKKFKKFLKNEKEPQGQQLANLVFEDLAQKTRNRVIVVRKFYRGSLLQRMGWHANL